jgi:hypothetical protein
MVDKIKIAKRTNPTPRNRFLAERTEPTTEPSFRKTNPTSRATDRQNELNTREPYYLSGTYAKVLMKCASAFNRMAEEEQHDENDEHIVLRGMVRALGMEGPGARS